jgi:hypothetical protein
MDRVERFPPWGPTLLEMSGKCQLGMRLPILGILDLLLLTVSSVPPSIFKCTLPEPTREDFDKLSARRRRAGWSCSK